MCPPCLTRDRKREDTTHVNVDSDKHRVRDIDSQEPIEFYFTMIESHLHLLLYIQLKMFSP